MEKLSGFISNDGARILSKKELAQADKKLNAAKEAIKAPLPETDTVEANLTNALGAVKSRSFQKINEVANRAQSAKSDLRDAKAQVRQEARVLKKLATALENGNEEKAKELGAEFEKLRESRSELSERIDNNNLERGARTPVRLGNKTLSNVTVDRVSFRDSVGEIDLSDAKSIRAARRDLLSSERQSLRAQTQEVNGELRKLRQSNREVKNTLKGLLNTDEIANAKVREPLSSLGGAEELTNQIATQIKEGGTKSFNTNQLDSQVVQQLVQS